MGEKPSIKLAERIDSFDLPLGRLKTGTPPRLDGRTIAWDKLEMQPGDDDPTMFSFLSKGPSAKQISCGITHTNEGTHDIIRDNLSRSAMYGGHIDGIGPRYCPSIEDKIVRFADKTSHQIFLEPEGVNDHTVYPNGISTSLPEHVQDAFIRLIPGLDKVNVFQYGYAIEYDYVDPRALDRGLQVQKAPGLFLAGQINGTTGYEEAGAQGLVAGMNAARRAKGLSIEAFDRAEAYIGVMIDDLVTRGVTEPYRMFTSRAEFRLSLRSDNADQRLTERGISLGLVGPERAKMFHVKQSELEAARQSLTELSLTPNAAAKLGWKVNQDGQRRSAWDYLAYPDIEFSNLIDAFPNLSSTPATITEQISIEATYSGYLERQKNDIEALRRDEALSIPKAFDYAKVGGLSNEVRSKLEAVRPETLGQAGRIEGVTPGALTALLAYVKRKDRKRMA